MNRYKFWLFLMRLCPRPRPTWLVNRFTRALDARDGREFVYRKLWFRKPWAYTYVRNS